MELAQHFSGEGNIIKHLALFQYELRHADESLSRFDFKISNLATDLRDGIRLSKLVDTWDRGSNLLSAMKYPAITRADMCMNMKAIFRYLKSNEMAFICRPEDIVDGHREKTLAFLWSLAFHYRIYDMVNSEELKQETQDIASRTGQTLADETLHQFDNQNTQLLLDWCRVVCAIYGLRIVNFRRSFADGQAFCYLIHHYRPELMNVKDVRSSNDYQNTAYVKVN